MNSPKLAIRIFNVLAAPLKLVGVGRLSESAILNSAQKSTGLRDFGDERFRKPLQLLIQDYNEDRDLTLLGKLIAKGMLTNLVGNRMLIHAHLSSRPEILDQEIDSPLFIVGLPRSGTTFLYNLLGQDTSFRSLLFWESCSPASPTIGGKKDRRVAQAIKTVSGLNRAIPELKSIHDFNATAPDECTGLLLNTFTTPYFRGRLPGYREWLFAQDATEIQKSYREYDQQLKLLQVESAPKPWLLKSPSHLFGLRQLLERFPTAKIIYLQRSLNDSVASLCSLSSALDTLSYSKPDPGEVGQRTLKIVKQFLQGGQRAIESEHSPRIRFVRFENLVTHPLDEVKQVYSWLEKPLPRKLVDKLRMHLSQNQQSKPLPHRYRLSDYGLNDSDLLTLEQYSGAGKFES